MTSSSSISVTGSRRGAGKRLASSSGKARLRRWTWAAVLAPPLFQTPAAAAAGLSSTDNLLDRIGERVELFWTEFSAVNCTETIEQVKLNPKGKTMQRETASYDYVILMQLVGNDLSVEESRIQQGKTRAKGTKKNRSLLITDGFATLVLVFHPHFQASYQFSPAEEESVGGKRLYRIDFRHLPGGRAPAVLQVGGRDYPIAWQGSAWVSPDSLSIVRIRAGLREPMTDIGLLRLDSDVQYAPVEYATSGDRHWLPEVAVIEAQTKRQHWRNVHRFSNYKHFSVNTEVTIEDPQ
jgi:hypothetical protein